MSFNETAGAQKSESKLPAADAFMNLKLVDANGKEYAIKSGCPLRMSNKLDRAIIEATKVNPEQLFTLIGNVHIVEVDDGRELELAL